MKNESLNTLNIDGEDMQLTPDQMKFRADFYIDELKRLRGMQKDFVNRKNPLDNPKTIRLVDRAVITRARELTRLGYKDQVKKMTGKKRI